MILTTMSTRRKNPAAVALGRLSAKAGGAKAGGKARMANLTPEERRALALKAIRARWAKAKTRAKKKPH
jgi:hypothetical protein